MLRQLAEIRKRLFGEHQQSGSAVSGGPGSARSSATGSTGVPPMGGHGHHALPRGGARGEGVATSLHGGVVDESYTETFSSSSTQNPPPILDVVGFLAGHEDEQIAGRERGADFHAFIVAFLSTVVGGAVLFVICPGGGGTVVVCRSLPVVESS